MDMALYSENEKGTYVASHMELRDHDDNTNSMVEYMNVVRLVVGLYGEKHGRK